MRIPNSELILRSDGSVYHLNLLPEDISDLIITVGDPDRVRTVTSFFNKIELEKQTREFLTITGYYKDRRISVVSTGIGTDNIDIVFNELDALANIDLNKRLIKSTKKQLTFIRIGTSGALQKDIPIDSFLVSDIAMGLDGLMHFYEREKVEEQCTILNSFENLELPVNPYLSQAEKQLVDVFSEKCIIGNTITATGFYGPQGRVLRYKLKNQNVLDDLAAWSFEDRRFTNLEMETAGIYGISTLLGHRAVSLNAILANRALGTFSENANETIQSLIKYTLNKIIAEKI